MAFRPSSRREWRSIRVPDWEGVTLEVRDLTERELFKVKSNPGAFMVDRQVEILNEHDGEERTAKWSEVKRILDENTRNLRGVEDDDGRPVESVSDLIPMLGLKDVAYLCGVICDASVLSDRQLGNSQPPSDG
jgi:hypothetical protein